MLRAEQLSHLREAGLSSSDNTENISYHRHVAQWIEHVLNGALEKYELEARAANMTDEERAKTLEEAVAQANLMPKDSGGDYLYE